MLRVEFCKKWLSSYGEKAEQTSKQREYKTNRLSLIVSTSSALCPVYASPLMPFVLILISFYFFCLPFTTVDRFYYYNRLSTILFLWRTSALGAGCVLRGPCWLLQSEIVQRTTQISDLGVSDHLSQYTSCTWIGNILRDSANQII